MDGSSTSVSTPLDASVGLAGPTTSRRRFFRHYLEMVVVMMVSMMVLGGLVSGILAVFGQPGLRDLPAGPRASVMTINMVIGMTAWMRLRRHGWSSTLEMDASMIVPFVLLVGPYWAGLLSGGALIGTEHLLMLPLMFLVMLRRYDEYAHTHRRHRSSHTGRPREPRRWEP